jgi:hypothetical protein
MRNFNLCMRISVTKSLKLHAVLQATENLSDQYVIGIVYKVLLSQHVFAMRNFNFTRNRQKLLLMMCKEIAVLGMHRNIINYIYYWIGEDHGLVLYEFMERSLHDILHESPLTWIVRFNIAPKNILIDDNMEPIIADFGTALFRIAIKK